MNSIAKITIPIEKLYQTINSAEVLSAQQLIERNSYEGVAYPIENVMHYTAASNAIAEVNKAIKAIQDARKMVTGPLDAYKKELMRIEADAVTPLATFIASTKVAMLEYNAACEKQFAAEQEKASTLESLVDGLTEVSIKHDHIKGIRTIRKVRIAGEVDWLKVLGVLFGSGMYKPEDFTQNLLKAMEKCGVDSIPGIEIYEDKIQTITR